MRATTKFPPKPRKTAAYLAEKVRNSTRWAEFGRTSTADIIRKHREGTGGGGGGGPTIDVTVLIPTRQRRATQYLGRTLAAYAREMGSGGGGIRLHVHVFDNDERGGPEHHAEFERQRSRYADVRSPGGDFFFHARDRAARGAFTRAHPADAASIHRKFKGAYQWMDAMNTRYTLDVAYMIDAAVVKRSGGGPGAGAAAAAAAAAATSDSDNDVFLVGEDDFQPCDGMAAVLRASLRAAAAVDARWSCVRLSFGGNGLVFRARDAAHLSTYLARRRTWRINDHILMEWFNWESPEAERYNAGRLHVVGRHNLFEHIGTESNWALQHSNKRYPLCFDRIWPSRFCRTLFQIERAALHSYGPDPHSC